MKTIFKTIILSVFSILLLLVPYTAQAEDHQYSTGEEHGTTEGATSKTWTQVSDDTWTMDLDGNGTTDVTLKTSKDADGNDVWTYTFNVEDNEKAYHVYEEMTGNGTDGPVKKGYTSKGSDDKEAIPQDPGSTDSKTHSYTITNTKKHTTQTEKTGTLSIAKTVSNPENMPDKDQKFVFTITLSGSTDSLKNKIKGTQIFGDVPFEDGVAKCSIGNGETKKITGLPEGITYSVSEEETSGYTEVSSKGTEGTIADGKTSSASFVNSSDYMPPENPTYGSFTLAKSVKGYPDKVDASYTFHVVLAGLTPNGKYSYGSESYTADENGGADVTVVLKDKESVEFTSLPTGSTYQVMEEAEDTQNDGSYISSYSITESGEKGEIAQPEGANTEKDTTLTTEKETVDEDEKAVITFTNDYPAVQNLTIRKLLVRHNIFGKDETYTDQSKKFHISVKFSNLPEGTVIISDYGKMTADGYGEASMDFDIKADGKGVVFRDLPVGAKYTVTETSADGYSSYYEITTSDMYGKDVEGHVEKKLSDETAGNDLSTETETVDENESDTVTFKNRDTKVILPMTGKRGIVFGIVLAGTVISLISLSVKKRKYTNR